jgi:transcriptional regulator with XRE-family HTH domain/mannose-6-phosphate isomerase-like protein (cupin superfamily)
MPDFNQYGLSSATVGARLKRLRLQQDLSVRDLADRASVDKNTILRLEKGLPTSGRTLARVCEALDIYVSRLLLPELAENETVIVHRQASEMWWTYPGMGEAFPDEEGGVSVSPAPTDTAVVSLACRLEQGRLRSSLLRLFAETTPNAHPGEEFVYCLKGAVRLTVAGRPYVLREGDAATFWCAERHTYAPEPGSETPALVLTVWLDARDERK